VISFRSCRGRPLGLKPNLCWCSEKNHRLSRDDLCESHASQRLLPVLQTALMLPWTTPSRCGIAPDPPRIPKEPGKTPCVLLRISWDVCPAGVACRGANVPRNAKQNARGLAGLLRNPWRVGCYPTGLDRRERRGLEVFVRRRDRQLAKTSWRDEAQAGSHVYVNLIWCLPQGPPSPSRSPTLRSGGRRRRRGAGGRVGGRVEDGAPRSAVFV
jgi:hypothetical protein